MEQLDVLRRPPIGAMIETPAALFALDEIFELADFVAIGTNDLTQYMLAADRDLSEGTDDCTAMHPAILRAIKRIVEAANQWKRPVCVCGEEAGDADFACLLVGLGIRELSLSPSSAVAVRQAIRGIDSHRAAEIADRRTSLSKSRRGPRADYAGAAAKSIIVAHLTQNIERIEMIPRLSESLLLRPDDVKPSRDEFKVIGVFNPGVIRVQDEVVLLVRVAEKPLEQRPGFVGLPRWAAGGDCVVDWVRR